MNEHISILQGYIDHLEYMKKNADDFFDKEQADKDIEAFKAAIKALEQKPCENAISRQDVLDLAKKGVLISNGNYKSVCKAINELPSVNPQPCEDAISRQAAIRIAERGQVQGYEWQFKELNKLPSVNPQSKTRQFAKWVATEIFDDTWEYNKDAFAEIACRKLTKLGIVRANGDEWELVAPQESEEV